MEIEPKSNKKEAPRDANLKWCMLQQSNKKREVNKLAVIFQDCHDNGYGLISGL